jgi:hypothetical protein
VISRRSGGLVALCLIGWSCDSPSSVPPAVRVTVIPHVDSVQIVPPLGAGSHRVHCAVTYELQPTSRPVSWRDAVFQFHFGAVRTQIDDQIYLSGDAIQKSWQTFEYKGASIVGSFWGFDAVVPFSVTAEMSYVVEGSATLQTVTPRFSCGPEPAPTDTPPRLTGSIDPPAELRPGSALRINYVASSTLGLWETSIYITGAFTQTIRQSENFTKSSQREVIVQVPAGATVGQPVHVGISTTDAALLNTSVTFTTAVIRP